VKQGSVGAWLSAASVLFLLPALLLSNITIAGNDYTQAILPALAMTALSATAAIFAWCFSRRGIGATLLALVVLLANAWVVLDSLRRLGA
jgi:predicted permease